MAAAAWLRPPGAVRRVPRSGGPTAHVQQHQPAARHECVANGAKHGRGLGEVMDHVEREDPRRSRAPSEASRRRPPRGSRRSRPGWPPPPSTCRWRPRRGRSRGAPTPGVPAPRRVPGPAADVGDADAVGHPDGQLAGERQQVGDEQLVVHAPHDRVHHVGERGPVRREGHPATVAEGLHDVGQPGCQHRADQAQRRKVRRAVSGEACGALGRQPIGALCSVVGQDAARSPGQPPVWHLPVSQSRLQPRCAPTRGT